MAQISELREYSLGCLHRTNPLRMFFIQIWQHDWFDQIIITCILANCIMLAFFDPLDPEGKTWRNQMLEYAETPFAVIFTIEMVVKIIAMDFVGSGSYLADVWNWVDFVVVIAG